MELYPATDFFCKHSHVMFKSLVFREICYTILFYLWLLSYEELCTYFKTTVCFVISYKFSIPIYFIFSPNNSDYKKITHKVTASRNVVDSYISRNINKQYVRHFSSVISQRTHPHAQGLLHHEVHHVDELLGDVARAVSSVQRRQWWQRLGGVASRLRLLALQRGIQPPRRVPGHRYRVISRH